MKFKITASNVEKYKVNEICKVFTVILRYKVKLAEDDFVRWQEDTSELELSLNLDVIYPELAHLIEIIGTDMTSICAEEINNESVSASAEKILSRGKMYQELSKKKSEVRDDSSTVDEGKVSSSTENLNMKNGLARVIETISSEKDDSNQPETSTSCDISNFQYPEGADWREKVKIFFEKEDLRSKSYEEMVDRIFDFTKLNEVFISQRNTTLENNKKKVVKFFYSTPKPPNYSRWVGTEYFIQSHYRQKADNHLTKVFNDTDISFSKLIYFINNLLEDKQVSEDKKMVVNDNLPKVPEVKTVETPVNHETHDRETSSESNEDESSNTEHSDEDNSEIKTEDGVVREILRPPKRKTAEVVEFAKGLDKNLSDRKKTYLILDFLQLEKWEKENIKVVKTVFENVVTYNETDMSSLFFSNPSLRNITNPKSADAILKRFFSDVIEDCEYPEILKILQKEIVIIPSMILSCFPKNDNSDKFFKNLFIDLKNVNLSEKIRLMLNFMGIEKLSEVDQVIVKKVICLDAAYRYLYIARLFTPDEKMVAEKFINDFSKSLNGKTNIQLVTFLRELKKFL